MTSGTSVRRPSVQTVGVEVGRKESLWGRECSGNFVVIVCKACLFTAISSVVFDHCNLYTLMTINFVLYAEA